MRNDRRDHFPHQCSPGSSTPIESKCSQVAAETTANISREACNRHVLQLRGSSVTLSLSCVWGVVGCEPERRASCVRGAASHYHWDPPCRDGRQHRCSDKTVLRVAFYKYEANPFLLYGAAPKAKVSHFGRARTRALHSSCVWMCVDVSGGWAGHGGAGWLAAGRASNVSSALYGCLLVF